MIRIFRKFFIIAGYNFIDTAKKSFFKIFTIIATLIIILGIFIPDFMAKFNVFNKKREYLIYMVDAKNYIFDNHLDLNLYSKEIKDLVDGQYYFKLLDDEVDMDFLNNEIHNGEIDGYLHVNNATSIDIVTLGNYPELKFILDGFILRKKINETFGTTGYNSKKFNINYNIKNLDLNKGKINDFLKKYSLPVVLMFFIYIIFVMYGQIISINTNIEKNSKITEVFLTKVNLSNIILGKVLGVLFAGIIQMIYFVSLFFLVVSLLDYESFPIIKSLVVFDPIFIFRFLVYFVLGFIFYGFIFLFVGNLINKTEDLSVGIIPIISLISLGYFLAVFSLQFPQNYLINLFKYVPFFTPFVVISNLPSNLISEIIMLIVMIVSIIIVVVINVNTFKSIIRFKGNKN